MFQGRNNRHSAASSGEIKAQAAWAGGQPGSWLFVSLAAVALAPSEAVLGYYLASIHGVLFDEILVHILAGLKA
jgi:hypothetical protein